MKTKYLIWFLFFPGMLLLSGFKNEHKKSIKQTPSKNIKTFTFSSNGNMMSGKIYLPGSYERNKALPVIFLIDFTEQHFKIATDEFEEVIDGVNQVQGLDALVASLENIADIDAEPGLFQDHYNIFKNMAAYVDSAYTSMSSKTLIGKGSESGIVLMALFLDHSEDSAFDNFIATDPSPKYASAIIDLIEKEAIAENKSPKKLHFSFSTSNDRKKCANLIKVIEDANYQWLQFESIEYTKSNFENTYPLAYEAGIKYIFE